MKICITGAAGFIGSHLTDYLLVKGHHVIGLDNLSTGNISNLENALKSNKFDFIETDIADLDILDNTIQKCDHIYHLAASVGVQLFVSNPAGSVRNNTANILNIIDLAGKYDKKLFFASSSEVYGKGKRSELKEEDDIIFGSPEILRWGYGCSKAIGEYLGLSYYREARLQIVIGRFFNICGPRQIGHYGMVIPRFIQAALNNDPIHVFGDGQQIRSFTFVNDAVNSITSLMNRSDSVGQIFNIGHGEKISIIKLAQLIKKLTHSDSSIIQLPYEDYYGDKFEDMRYRVPDTSKLKAYLGSQKMSDIETLLTKTISWWKRVQP